MDWWNCGNFIGRYPLIDRVCVKQKLFCLVHVLFLVSNSWYCESYFKENEAFGGGESFTYMSFICDGRRFL